MLRSRWRRLRAEGVERLAPVEEEMLRGHVALVFAGDDVGARDVGKMVSARGTFDGVGLLDAAGAGVVGAVGESMKGAANAPAPGG